MKKVLLTVSILLIVLISAVGFMIYSIVTKEKDSISAEQFRSLMEERGYLIFDVTSQYEEYGYVEKAYIATTSDKKYQIEFYVLSDDEEAIYFYNTNKIIFENSKGGVSSQTTSEISNYSKYALSSNDKYMVISRINNTAIYLNVEDEYKDIIKDLLKEIGY